MEYRSLGRSGIKVSPLCLGTMFFGGRMSETESFKMMDACLDAGINFFDCANVYTGGRSEEVLGDALKKSRKRDRVILATKVHFPVNNEDPNASGNNRRHILDQCEKSLNRLKTDYIDLYYLHRPQPAVPIDESLRALDDLIRSGKVRYIGSSTFAAWQVMESLWVSKELNLNRFIAEQPPYNILDRRVERELVPMAKTYGIALMPWSPLAEGFLTDRYRRGTEPAADSRAGQDKHLRQQRYTDKVFDVIESVQQLAREKGCSTVQLALAWNMQQPGITSPIMGPRTIAHLNDCLGALNVQITPEDCQCIDLLVPPCAVVSEYYDADFGPHQFGWI
jgi:aryl-alcohol dehydrogenase-like predicted oxidoreductase